ncbi:MULTISPECIES: FimV/HubP family polar landmark protein [unclassified Neisseria]|uniref:FimV/HubP family polar landmark protein n=1 Tax=unclassified Neisseria TaxID=2623750 RepID=UPI002665552B|nr:MULTISPECIES: FimV/HubP family polar landmark protein [unclassified Neisseria]MDO1509477.1 FimV/HubP family polar landmark protein [Neisseria sp. MVDL19-042950]MDO1515750.1 FimV/HubP family polar landmark protein [Neisseria sp. MVDL18-041461]MDO1563426.1 FimV/HubP family polar landmark protein [Neisseria sp. MVDL20-010259]
MKNNHRIKLIAASVALITSFSAVAGLGGLNVQSNLGEPFAGTVTVTGEEAKILLNGGAASLSDGSLRTSVRKSGDNAIINIRSNSPVQDPVLVFQINVGAQSRQYTAIIDPPDYSPENTQRASVAEEQQNVRDRIFSTVPDAEKSELTSSGTGKLKDKKAQEQKQSKQAQQKTDSVDKTNTNKGSEAVASTEKTVADSRSEPQLKGEYTVRKGETLTAIASRIRPNGLTVSQTVQALVLANPESFKNRNANQIVAGAILNIPSAAELKRFAKEGAQVATQEPSAIPGAASAPTSQVPVEKPSASTPSASAPAETGLIEVPVPASEVTETEAAKVVPVPASEVEVPAASDLPASVVEAPKADAESETESGGWWRWLLFGGLGLIALLLLLKKAGKRKAADEEYEEYSDDIQEDEQLFDEQPSDISEIRTHQPVAHPSHIEPLNREKAAASLAAARAGLMPKKDGVGTDELSVEDDFDDEIFFTEAKNVPVEETEENINLDLGSIDRQQGGIVSGALTQDEETEQRKYADWDKIESTESVYEPEPENAYQHVAVELEAVKEEVPEQIDNVVDIEADSPEIEEPVGETQQEEVGHIELDVYSEEAQAGIDQLQTETVQISDASEEEHAISSVVEPLDIQADEQEEVQSASNLEPLEFTTVTKEDEVPVGEDKLHVSTEAALAEELSATVDSEESSAEQQQQIADSSVAASSDSEWFDVKMQDDGIAFQDSEDFADVEVVTDADDSETIEWESINVADEDTRGGSGFISESVGMTAPLEAKYELAQMYMEIGDPEAARETLLELLEESSGDIFARAKTMLEELDN